MHGACESFSRNLQSGATPLSISVTEFLQHRICERLDKLHRGARSLWDMGAQQQQLYTCGKWWNRFVFALCIAIYFSPARHFSACAARGWGSLCCKYHFESKASFEKSVTCESTSFKTHPSMLSKHNFLSSGHIAKEVCSNSYRNCGTRLKLLKSNLQIF